VSAVNALDTLLKAFFNILLLTDKSTISLWDVSVPDTRRFYLMLFRLLAIIGFLDAAEESDSHSNC